MSNSNDHQRLRQILLVKWLVTLFVWGLPALLGPTALFGILRVPMPDDLTFVRLFGAVVSAVALAYFYAWKDPERNVAILKFGVLDNGLVTFTILALALVTGLTSWFLLGSAVLTAFFCIAFLVLMPRATPG